MKAITRSYKNVILTKFNSFNRQKLKATEQINLNKQTSTHPESSFTISIKINNCLKYYINNRITNNRNNIPTGTQKPDLLSTLGVF